MQLSTMQQTIASGRRIARKTRIHLGGRRLFCQVLRLNMAVNGMDQGLAPFARQCGNLENRPLPAQAFDKISHARPALL